MWKPECVVESLKILRVEREHEVVLAGSPTSSLQLQVNDYKGSI